MAIEANHYRETRAKLVADPIIQAMAAEIQQRVTLEEALAYFTHNGTRRGTDEGDGPTHRFMGQALDEYKKRGGTVDTHIGGPAEAVLIILKGDGGVADQ